MNIFLNPFHKFFKGLNEHWSCLVATMSVNVVRRADSSLRSLLAPMTRATFTGDFLEKRHMIFPGSAPRVMDCDDVSDLFSRRFLVHDSSTVQAGDFWNLSRALPNVPSSRATSSTKRLVDEEGGGDVIRRMKVRNKHVKNVSSPLPEIHEAFVEGYSLVFSGMERFSEPAWRLANCFYDELGGVPLRVDGCLTPPRSMPSGFVRPSTGTFLLQQSGSQKITFHPDRHFSMNDDESTFILGHDGSDDTFLSSHSSTKKHQMSPRAIEFTLNAGDAIYLPSFTRHRTETRDDVSLHLSIAVDSLAVSYANLVSHLCHTHALSESQTDTTLSYSWNKTGMLEKILIEECSRVPALLSTCPLHVVGQDGGKFIDGVVLTQVKAIIQELLASGHLDTDVSLSYRAVNSAHGHENKSFRAENVPLRGLVEGLYRTLEATHVNQETDTMAVNSVVYDALESIARESRLSMLTRTTAGDTFSALAKYRLFGLEQQEALRGRQSAAEVDSDQHDQEQSQTTVVKKFRLKRGLAPLLTHQAGQWLLFSGPLHFVLDSDLVEIVRWVLYPHGRNDVGKANSTAYFTHQSGADDADVNTNLPFTIQQMPCQESQAYRALDFLIKLGALEIAN